MFWIKLRLNHYEIESWFNHFRSHLLCRTGLHLEHNSRCLITRWWHGPINQVCCL